jgi:hypothetical protein
MTPTQKRKALLALGALAVVATGAGIALARPGGGSSFSGGSSGGSGGSSSGGGFGGAIAQLFILLCVEHPYIGVPILLIVIGLFIWSKVKKKGYSAWSAGAGEGGTQGAPVVADMGRGARKQLETIRGIDPNFSFVLFEDFLYALYFEAHTARGQGQLARVSAYLEAGVIAQLSSAPPALVENIVVGAMRIVSAQGCAGDLPEVSVVVQLETNYTETARAMPASPGRAAQAAGKPQSYYVVERWTLTRKKGVVSRTPDRARVFGCPSCGAPQDYVMAGTCRHCNQPVASGAFDWVVRAVQLVHKETRGPMLTGTTEEVGTDDPTVVDPELLPRFAALQAKDPQFQFPALQARIGLIFNEFQAAWSSRDLARMRPFMSDMLFMTQSYWVETYKRQGLRNVTENARILGMQLARVVSDKFYDAVTVRVYATSLDFTLEDKSNKVMGGSRSKERRYSEYWTLIRGTNRKGPARTDPVCPSCGAALKINMVGKCEYCNARVTSGDFDWVLSRIEQDEVYEG